MQHRAMRDPWARRATLAHTAWVVAYDVPWSYGLWQLNPGARDVS